MKFSTKEDIEAPIDVVFEMLCDFEMFERGAMRRSAEVQWTDIKTVRGVGMMWRAMFNLRGKRRQVDIEMVTLDQPHEMVLECKSPGLFTTMTAELVALSKTRTRVMVVFDIKPLNLLLQSIKLAKASMTEKYKLRVVEFAKSMEERYEWEG